MANQTDEADDTTPDLDADLDDTPDEIRDFLAESGVGKKYQCVIKEHKPGAKPGTLDYMNNQCPDVPTIGKRWGPGEYSILLSWKVPKPGGGRQNICKEHFISLPERGWREIHEKWLAERSEQSKKERERDLEKAKQEAQISAARESVTGPAQKDPLDTLKAAMATLKELGVPVGGRPDAGRPLDFVGIATAIGALAPLIKLLIPEKKEDGLMLKMLESQAATNAILLKSILDRSGAPQGGDHLTKIMDMTMGAMGRVLEFQDMLKPAEKETLVDKIFGTVDRFLPQVMELAKMTSEQREKSMVYKVAQASPEMDKARKHPDLAIALVNKWDGFYGYQQTNDILKVAGIARPPETMENYKQFPSDGYDNEGNLVIAGQPPKGEGENVEAGNTDDTGLTE